MTQTGCASMTRETLLPTEHHRKWNETRREEWNATAHRVHPSQAQGYLERIARHCRECSSRNHIASSVALCVALPSVQRRENRLCMAALLQQAW
jgi:hypothetical protein